MFGRFNDALQTAADVLAPPPTNIQNFEYHWKHVKNFYAMHKVLPKVHIKNTNLPMHLEDMLKLLIEEECQRNEMAKNPDPVAAEKCTPADKADSNAHSTHSMTASPAIVPMPKSACFEFVLRNQPFDLLTDICLTDSPPGASVCILKWMRRFLTCLERPRLDHKIILQPIQKLIVYCASKAGCASPYKQEEIVFLLTVAGFIRKEPLLLHLLLPKHEHSLAVATLNPSLGMKTPIKNTLFENAKLDSSLRRISLVHGSSTVELDDAPKKAVNDDAMRINVMEGSTKTSMQDITTNNSCDCSENDSFILFDTILRYFDSADSVVVVRACEAALILISLPTISTKCSAQNSTFERFCKLLSQKLVLLCQEIPSFSF